MTHLHIQDRGIIYDSARQPAAARIAFFTSLCRLRSGVWLCGFQVGPAKQSPQSTIGLCRSHDGGRTWTRQDWQFETLLDGIPGSLSTAEMVEVEPGRLLLFATWFDRSDPRRPLFNPATQGILRSRQLLAVSTDDGLSWSGWRDLPTPELAGCATTGPVVQWADGTLAYTFESFKEYDDPRPACHAAWIIVSRDAGQTFSRPLLVAHDPAHHLYYWDQRLCATSRAGEFVAMFWTHDGAAKRDRHVHIRRAAVVGSAIIGEDIRETTLPGQIAAPLMLADGRLLAFIVDRRGPCMMTLWQSPDEGKSWPEEKRLIIHAHEERAAVTPGGEVVDFNQYWEDMGKWSFGHPALHPLDDGRVLCAYYAGTPDCMSIHWAAVGI